MGGSDVEALRTYTSGRFRAKAECSIYDYNASMSKKNKSRLLSLSRRNETIIIIIRVV